jgi:hypothetical protein
MNVEELKARMKRWDKNAEVIFDAEEPVGTPTDLVMPRGRTWNRIRKFFGKERQQAIIPNPTIAP